MLPDDGVPAPGWALAEAQKRLPLKRYWPYNVKTGANGSLTPASEWVPRPGSLGHLELDYDKDPMAADTRTFFQRLFSCVSQNE